MRKSKEYKIDEDVKVIIYEVKWRDVYKLAGIVQGIDIAEFEKAIEIIKDTLPMISTLTEEQFDDLAPSEILEMGNMFLEMNSPFLEILDYVGIKKAMLSQLDNLVGNFKNLLGITAAEKTKELTEALMKTVTETETETTSEEQEKTLEKSQTLLDSKKQIVELELTST